MRSDQIGGTDTSPWISLPPTRLNPDSPSSAQKERRQQNIELMNMASRATDEHIAALPPSHRPIIEMLRHMARQQAEEDERRRNRSSAERLRFLPLEEVD